MAGVAISVQTGAAPQGGVEQYQCSDPTSLSDFQSDAATAASSSGSFILVVTNGGESLLLNLARITAVVGT